VGPLVRVDQIEEGEETLNGARYLTILQRHLLQNYPKLKNQRLYFQQDNALRTDTMRFSSGLIVKECKNHLASPESRLKLNRGCLE